MVGLIALWGLVGALVGGPVSALSAYLPRRAASALRQGRCPACGAHTGLTAALPVLGHRARSCGSCGAPLREKWPGVEIALAAIYGALAWRFGLGWPLAMYSLFTTILVLVFLTDLRHHLILNVVIYPSLLLALALMFFTTGPQRALLGGLLAGGIFLGFYLLALLVYRRSGGLGEGDVKLALLVGLVTGLPAAYSAIFLGTVFGAILALTCLAVGRSRFEPMPYGTALVAGTLATILVDPTIWR